MRVIIFGASGMLGKAALLECLDDTGVTEVIAVVRRPLGLEHAKLRELVHTDFLDYSAIEGNFAGLDACLYCVGISVSGLSEAEYRRVTVELAVAASRAMLKASPGMRMCFVSGAGTDRNGSQMWSRVKAEAEDAMLAMPWRSAHMFRPAAVFPRRGVVSRTPMYRAMYGLLGWAYSPMKALMPAGVTTSDHFGKAMLAVARNGHPLQLLESRDINAVDTSR